jgi:hypothetical protein
VSAGAGVTPKPSSDTRFVRWHRRVLGICLIIFAFELGLFLLVFPWLPNWDLNWIPLHSPFLSDLWMNQYFRGGLSGLGLLNIYVAVAEAGRQIAGFFSRKSE